jgi:hypothetical protein
VGATRRTWSSLYLNSRDTTCQWSCLPVYTRICMAYLPVYTCQWACLPVSTCHGCASLSTPVIGVPTCLYLMPVSMLTSLHLSTGCLSGYACQIACLPVYTCQLTCLSGYACQIACLPVSTCQLTCLPVDRNRHSHA